MTNTDIKWRDNIRAARKAEAAGDYVKAGEQWVAAIFHCPHHYKPGREHELAMMRRELRKCDRITGPVEPPF